MGRPKIDLKELERRIKVRYPDEDFTVIQYESLGKPGIVKCNNCGKEISVSKMTNFFVKTKPHGCVNCYGLWKERDRKIEEIKELYDIISTKVVNTHTHYTIQCKNCGHQRTTDLKNLYKHLQCGCQTNVKRNRTPEEFIQEVNDNSRLGTYELISDYVNQSTKVLLRHDCGFIWEVRPSDVIHGKSQCPKCMSFQSKGVLYIKKILDKNQIPYEQERRLDNSKQRFDFYFEFGDINIALEYNGAQHYKEIDYFQTSLQQQQERDNRKRQYCIEHNIELIEIPYTFSKEQIQTVLQEKIIYKFNDYSARKQN